MEQKPMVTLSELRIAAKYKTQAALAKDMRVSQSLISKWEKDINTASPKDILKLARFLGVSLEEIMGSPFSKSAFEPMSKGTPYRNFIKHLHVLGDYFEIHPDIDCGNESNQTSNLLNEFLRRFIRKPLVGLSGRYDSGKSTLINEFLGNDVLPTSYQPMTSLPVVIMHSDMKPQWMKQEEEALIMAHTDINSIFSSTGNERIVMGTSTVLLDFASHKGSKKIEHAKMGALFLDNPALHLCSFLDLPGYKHNIDDTALASEFYKEIDYLIYTSPIMGCMDEYDLTLMSEQLLTLPSFEQGNDNFPTLGNFILAITRCGQDETNDTIQDAIKAISNRTYQHYKENTFKNRSEIIGRTITLDDFQKRLIPFSNDVPRRRKGFINEIQESLSEIIPQIWETKAKQAIEEIKKTATKEEQIAIRKINNLLKKQKRCAKDYEKLKNNMPQIRKEIKKTKTDITEFIKECSRDSVKEFYISYESFATKKSLAKLIEKQYGKDKKTAAKQIGSYVSECLSGASSEISKKYSIKLKERLEESFEELKENLDGLLPQIFLDDCIEQKFGTKDIKSYFISGLAGLGTLGALSIWAATVAAGSNLGGYILVAKISGILSSIGISVGGPTLVSFVASIGGPLVAGTGLGLIIAVATWGAYKLFGPSWSEKLAGKLIKGMNKENTSFQFAEKIEEYWDSTLYAVDKGFDGIVVKMEKELEILRKLTEAGPETVKELKQQLSQHEKVLAFFESMPRL